MGRVARPARQRMKRKMNKSNPERQNLVPLPYRQVSVQPYHGPMTAEAIAKHLLGKDSYRRTRYVILEQGQTCAIAAVSREGGRSSDQNSPANPPPHNTIIAGPSADCPRYIISRTSSSATAAPQTSPIPPASSMRNTLSRQ